MMQDTSSDRSPKLVEPPQKPHIKRDSSGPVDPAPLEKSQESRGSQNVHNTIWQEWPASLSGLQKEFAWFREIFQKRIDTYFNKVHFDFFEIKPPLLAQECRYAELVEKYELKAPERLLLILAWVGEFFPSELDMMQTKNKHYALPFSEFGGVYNTQRAGFQPTFQTGLFLISGADPAAAVTAAKIFNPGEILFQENLLAWPGDPASIHSKPLLLTEKSRHHLLHGQQSSPVFQAGFPATKLTTHYEWNELILPQATRAHLDEIRLWLKHGETLRHQWQMNKSLAPGYKALFYGPPGTGKTMTAALLGKMQKRDVYRIDLSQIVSKWIGETEKNLERVFKRAEKESWILFFDEADALFGRRTSVSSSNDRHANMETGYLLQRIEECPNLIILASNLKENIDEAFLRRFASIVHFTKPGEKERLKLWQQGFSPQANLTKLNLSTLARTHELTGAEINNAIRYASLMALEHHGGEIQEDDIITAIRRENYKSGRLGL